MATDYTWTGKVTSIGVRSIPFFSSDPRTMVTVSIPGTTKQYVVGLDPSVANRMLAVIMNAQNNNYNVTAIVTGANAAGNYGSVVSLNVDYPSD